MSELPDPDSDSAADSPPDPAPDPAPKRLPLFLSPAVVLDRRAVLGLAVLLLLAVGYGVQHFWLSRPHPVAIPATTATTSTTPAEPAPARGGSVPPATTGSTVVVDIAGKVQSPGLRTLPGGSRVADALRAAGGPLPGTDTDSLNLARILNDGEQILVGGPPPAVGPSTPGGPVSLNRATAEQLDTLPGVGPTLARRILQYRQDHGPFRSLDQLRQVPGIGARKYEDLKPMLTL
ncbi:MULTISPECIES: ComEA family DNA-binding protein [Kitasatospora]|uniref:Competence protein ComEA n=2 Tax=Kitasatospora TaxID=2063 RepID=A0ABT1IZR1_9ACTN|nr:ComEA family DNA-binding protein [Kitasatospora paracochleata]MCP2310408.1 competence protein ComEA [Kitasatospora paracochleata]